MLTKLKGSDFLFNPLTIQHAILAEIENRLDGNGYIADSNSAFSTLLEAGSCIATRAMTEAHNVFPTIYANVAQTSRDLYHHFSDFDHINMFSTPASMELVLAFETMTLRDKALDYNENYKKAIIPRDSVFTVGQYTFGIHYPIEIQINKFNGNISAQYDTKIDNPMLTLTRNTIEQREEVLDGIPMMSIKIPIYQFVRQYISADAIANVGFFKQYNFNNKFYNCRIYSKKNNAWTELKVTLSDVIYDPAVPTAKLSVEPEINKFSVEIPQIYFTNGKIGSKIMLEVYTSNGVMDVDISTFPAEAFTASFNLNSIDSSPYSNIFKNYPNLKSLPYSKKILGGSNGLTFEEAKSRTINNTFHSKVLITPAELEAYFKDTGGFTVLKYLDNISNRIYFCHKALTDAYGSFIPATHTTVKLTDTDIDNSSQIVKCIDGSITILPTTIYKYNDSAKTSTIVSDIDNNILNNLLKEDFVSELNNNTYTKSPFHLHIGLATNNNRYPTAISYNLIQPKINYIKFEADNDSITSQMVMYDANIEHLKQGTDGYKIRFTVAKSPDLAEIPETDIVVYFGTTDSLGEFTGLTATYIGKQSNFFIYEVLLNTKYFIDNNTIDITNINQHGHIQSHMISLETDWYITFMLKKGYFPNTPIDNALIIGLPNKIVNEYLGMSKQKINIHLGHSLNDVVYNIVDTTHTSKVYKTHQVIAYHTYLNDEYEMDENGGLVIVDIVDNKPVLNKIHSKNDYVLDEFGERKIKHNVGDYLLDTNGNPITEIDRVTTYWIHMMQVDMKMYASEHPTQQTFVTELPALLETYFNMIKSSANQILEQTEIYFRPIRTLGTASFSSGDGYTLRQSLDMVFKMKVYVPPYVKNSNELSTKLYDDIVKITEIAILTKGVSMTDIADKIKTQLNDVIISIDVLGINNNTALQTIFIVDEDAQASLSHQLYIDKNGNIGLKKGVNLDIVSMEVKTQYS